MSKGVVHRYKIQHGSNKRHPGIVTGHTKDGNIDWAQCSNCLPEQKYPHQKPSVDVVPSANLHNTNSPGRTSYINTGIPDSKDPASMNLDVAGRKANSFDTMRLKWNQCEYTVHLNVPEGLQLNFSRAEQSIGDQYYIDHRGMKTGRTYHC
jgi:hypothetical protein